MNVYFLAAALIAFPTFARAADAPAPPAKIPFAFKDAEISDIVIAYAKASGQKFVIPGKVHGKATIAIAAPVTLDEAYNLMSAALAQEGCAISKQGEVNVIEEARDIERSQIDVVTELPPPQPDQVVMYVVQLKNLVADDVSKQLMRIMPSKYGEMTVVPRTNQIVIADFVSSLYRQKKLIEELERSAAATKPPAPAKPERAPKRKN